MTAEEEKPSEIFVRAVWDAAASIAYVAGALAVHLISKAFGSEGVPVIVKIVLFALEVGFVLVAIGSVIRACISLTRNIKDLGREMGWAKLTAALHGTRGNSGRTRLGCILLRGISAGLTIFGCVLVAVFVENIPVLVVIVVLIVAGYLLSTNILWPRLMRRIEADLDEENRKRGWTVSVLGESRTRWLEPDQPTIATSSWSAIIGSTLSRRVVEMLIVGSFVGLQSNILDRSVIDEVSRLFDGLL